LQLSDPCKRVLAYAAEETEKMGQQHIEPEHLLLGVLRENGPEAQVLAGLGIELEAVRLVFQGSTVEPRNAAQSAVRLLSRVPAERLAAAARILAGLSSVHGRSVRFYVREGADNVVP